MNHSSPEQPADTVARLRATFRTGRTKPVEWRTTQLRRLRELLTEHGGDLAAALHTDLGKSATEAHRTETDFTIREIDHTLRHLAEWLRPESAPVPAHLGADATAWTQYDPPPRLRPGGPQASCSSSPPGTTRPSSCSPRSSARRPRATRWSPSPASSPRPPRPPSPG